MARRKQKLRKGYMKPFSSSMINGGYQIDRSGMKELYPSARPQSLVLQPTPGGRNRTRLGGTYVTHNGSYAKVKRFEFEHASPERHVVLKEELAGASVKSKLMLYLPNDKSEGWVFVLVTSEERLRSLHYSSRERAMTAYHSNRITWMERQSIT